MLPRKESRRRSSDCVMVRAHASPTKKAEKSLNLYARVRREVLPFLAFAEVGFFRLFWFRALARLRGVAFRRCGLCCLCCRRAVWAWRVRSVGAGCCCPRWSRFGWAWCPFWVCRRRLFFVSGVVVAEFLFGGVPRVVRPFCCSFCAPWAWLVLVGGLRWLCALRLAWLGRRWLGFAWCGGAGLCALCRRLAGVARCVGALSSPCASVVSPSLCVRFGWVVAVAGLALCACWGASRRSRSLLGVGCPSCRCFSAFWRGLVLLGVGGASVRWAAEPPSWVKKGGEEK